MLRGNSWRRTADAATRGRGSAGPPLQLQMVVRARSNYRTHLSFTTRFFPMMIVYVQAQINNESSMPKSPGVINRLSGRVKGRVLQGERNALSAGGGSPHMGLVLRREIKSRPRGFGGLRKVVFSGIQIPLWHGSLNGPHMRSGRRKG